MRERRRPKQDPYNPDRQIPGTWEGELDELPLEGMWLDQSSSVAPVDAVRSQVVTSYSLFGEDPRVDVRAGDRIRSGDQVLYVNVRPAAPWNPFTGWQPYLEIRLEEVER